MKDRGLNDRQMEFARLISKGMSQSDAYRKAFDCSGKSENTIYSRASRLARNDKVCEFLTELRQEKNNAAIIDRTQRLEVLSGLALSARDVGDARAAVACIAEMNKMDGAYEPERVQVTGTLGVGAVVAALKEAESEPFVC